MVGQANFHLILRARDCGSGVGDQGYKYQNKNGNQQSELFQSATSWKKLPMRRNLS